MTLGNSQPTATDAPQGLETPVWDRWEEWRPVVLDGQEWPYEVSDCGRVRRTAPGSNRTFAGRLRKPHPTRKGYLRVDLWKDGRRKSVDVHKLVAEAFLMVTPPGFEINHEDGDKANNRSWNLTFVTSRGNKQHAVRKGLHRGSRKVLSSSAAVLAIAATKRIA